MSSPRHRQEGRRLVAADIERAHDEGPVAQFARDLQKGVELFVFRRRRLAVQKKELGPQKADAFRARPARRRQLRQHPPTLAKMATPVTVEGLGRLQARPLFLARLPPLRGLALPQLGEKIVPWIAPDFTRGPVEGQQARIFQICR